MILIIKATRRSADLADDMPNAGDGHIQGSQILEFEVPYEGSAPTVVVDCRSKHAFDMHQVRGEALPRRACPMRPKGAAPHEDGPPEEWLNKETGLLDTSIFDSGDPKNPLQPSDKFGVVSVATCNDCPLASGGTVAIKKEQDAIRTAFHAQLQIEDFSGFDLTDEDRDHRRWNIAWGDITIVS
jgi:hypothetical protein